MRKLFAILLLFPILLGSCEYFGRRDSEEELLERELKSINWNEVDEYPSVSTCEKLEDKDLQRSCFFEFLASTIQQKLNVDTLAILYPNLDTIQVRVTVFPDSTLKFEPNFQKDSLAYDTRKIDSILHSRLVDLPKVSPAIKRGIPVKSQFVLPVILKME